MLLIKPYAHETIWGGARLKEFCDSDSNQIGHLYSLYDEPSQSNEILNGSWKGRTLHEYFTANKEKFHLEQYDYFPVVIALVEAKENLSIQVHPQDETATGLAGTKTRGKHESWFFLDVPQEGYIYCNCLCQDLAQLKKQILQGKIGDVTHHLPVKKGDYVYVEGGTLHAMTAGSFVYEIEENAGATFRFFDFDRVDDKGERRPLHIPDAFFSIDLEKKAKVSRYGAEPKEERLYRTQHFSAVSHYVNGSDSLQVVTFLSNSSSLEGIPLRFGTSVLLEPKEEISFDVAEIMMAEPK